MVMVRAYCLRFLSLRPAEHMYSCYITIGNPPGFRIVVSRLRIVQKNGRPILNRDEVENHDWEFTMIENAWFNQLPWPHAQQERCVLAPVAGFMTKCDA